VLVADDEASLRTLLRRALTGAGFAVWLAADGREAVEVYRRQRGHIDLVLLDVTMPGWGGLRALRELHALGAQLPCCLMGGDADGCTAEDLEALGVSHFFSKPFLLSELVRRLKLLTARASGR
jgi:CheY-like chemotaxis protein